MSKSKKKLQNEIYKLKQEKVVKAKGKLCHYNDEDARLQGEVVRIMDNLVFKKIRDYYDERKMDISDENISSMAKDIVNIVVPMDKMGEREYSKLARSGITINDIKFNRIISGSGQIRRNTVSFMKDELYEYIFNALLCGLTLEDFGTDFNAAKFNAYFGLNMSGCHLLSEFPTVCIIDDYESIVPDIAVNYIKSKEIKYLVFEDGDYILTEGQHSFVLYDSFGGITDSLADASEAVAVNDVNSENATRWKVFSGTKKWSEITSYKDIENAPALNSFDGQGLANPKWVKQVAMELGFYDERILADKGKISSGYLPSEMIIRAPWIKGLVATFPISDFLKEHGVSECVDADGRCVKVDDIDIFLSKSQFKMYKIYRKKCENMELSPWQYHQQAMKDNGLLWGIVMPNKQYDDKQKELNYQYNEALNLYQDSDIDELCRGSEEFLKKLCSHDLKIVYDTLISHKKVERQESCRDEDLDEEAMEEGEYQSFLQKAISHNCDLIKDSYFQRLVNKECRSKFKSAKIGKIISDGNFQFMVSDPVAQAEWILKNHTTAENKSKIVVKGVVPSGFIYSDYWRKQSVGKLTEQIVLMRSPLIDQHEVTKMNLMMEENKYFRYLQSGIVLSIHDLATLQMQNCDFDGDRCYSSNMEILKKGCLDKAYPLYYETSNQGIVGKVTADAIINADIRGLNSRVGQISNKSACFYAMLPLYDKDSKEYQDIRSSITVLGEVVGVEIDKIKTGIAPVEPCNWKPIQVTYIQMEKEDGHYEKVCKYNDKQAKAIYKHNELVPDVKPYFFRYNYAYLDTDIAKLEKEINKECKFNYGLNLEDILDKYDNDKFLLSVKKLLDTRAEHEKANKDLSELTEAELEQINIYRTISKYKRAYPVRDSDCIMNKICHKFEELEKKYSDFNDGNNILDSFISINENDIDQGKLRKVKSYINVYKRHKKFITKCNNMDNRENNKSIAKDTKEKLDLLLEVTRKNIYGLFEKDDMQGILNYMYMAIPYKRDVDYIWDILAEDLLTLIPPKHFKTDLSLEGCE